MRHSHRGRIMRAAASAAACAIALTTGVTALGATVHHTGNMVVLPLTLPKPVFAGTPSDTYRLLARNAEMPTGKPRPLPLVPKGTVNLALHRRVTSGAAPFNGTLDLVTDGNKEARDDSVVELKPRLQWIQIDLARAARLFYIVLWHSHSEPLVYHSVIIQLSNDPNFVQGVTTVYNNDQGNREGMGAGKDREYFETNEGRLVDAKGIKARYVRLYSHGSTGHDQLNRYTEVEVYGLPGR